MDIGKFYERFIYRDIVGYFLPGVFLILGVLSLPGETAGSGSWFVGGVMSVSVLVLITVIGFGLGLLLLGPGYILDRSESKKRAAKAALGKVIYKEGKEELRDLLCSDYGQERQVVEEWLTERPHTVIIRCRNWVKRYKHYDMEMGRLKAIEVFSRNVLIVAGLLITLSVLSYLLLTESKLVDFAQHGVLVIMMGILAYWTNRVTKPTYYEAILNGYLRNHLRGDSGQPKR